MRKDVRHIFDYKLKLMSHIDEICKKASRKLSAVARIAPYTGISKRRTLMNDFLSHSLIIAH